ncbi:MAG: hypothetical protein ACMXYL_01250 [Candidatus Woesearchaeota archaeon]
MEIASIIGNLSAFLIIISACFYYFGRIIADTKVQSFDYYSMLVTGFYFVLSYILVPLSLALYFFSTLNYKINFLLVIAIQIVLFGFYSKYKYYKEIQIFNIQQLYNKTLRKKLTELKKSNKSYVTEQMDVEKNISMNNNFYSKLFRTLENQFLVFLICTFLIYATVSFFQSTNSYRFFVVLILTFVNLSYAAMVLGSSKSHFPIVTVTFLDGTKIKGKLLKNAEFIYLIKGKKQYHLNKSQIKIIEHNLLKKDK